MNVVVGDDTGLLKVVSLKSDGKIKKLGTQSEERGGITAMCWAGPNSEILEQEVAIGLSGGDVEVWNTMLGQVTASFEAMEFNSVKDKYVGVHVLRTKEAGINVSDAAARRRILTCLQSGNVRILPWTANIHNAGAGNEDEAEEAARAGVSWSVGSHIERLRLSNNQQRFLVGGNENLLSSYDVERQVRLFKAKTMPDDWLKIRVPNWDLDFNYLPSVETSTSSSSSSECGGVVQDLSKIVTVNAYKRVRLYDTKASHRPVVNVQLGLGEHSGRTLACLNNGTHIVVGDTAGRMQLLDIRYNFRQVGIFRGQAGSLREIVPHATLPMMASVGLDRHLRIHDIEDRKLLKAVYMTQKLTGCLFSSVEPRRARTKESVSEDVAVKGGLKTRDGTESKASAAQADGDEEEDAVNEANVWSELEQLTAAQRKQKLKQLQQQQKQEQKQRGDLSSDNDDDHDGEEEEEPAEMEIETEIEGAQKLRARKASPSEQEANVKAAKKAANATANVNANAAAAALMTKNMNMNKNESKSKTPVQEEAEEEDEDEVDENEDEDDEMEGEEDDWPMDEDEDFEEDEDEDEDEEDYIDFDGPMTYGITILGADDEPLEPAAPTTTTTTTTQVKGKGRNAFITGGPANTGKTQPPQQQQQQRGKVLLDTGVLTFGSGRSTSAATAATVNSRALQSTGGQIGAGAKKKAAPVHDSEDEEEDEELETFEASVQQNKASKDNRKPAPAPAPSTTVTASVSSGKGGKGKVPTPPPSSSGPAAGKSGRDNLAKSKPMATTVMSTSTSSKKR